MATFYRPDAKSEQVYNEAGKPVSYDEYKALGGTGKAGAGAFADVKYAPLPQVAQQQPQAQAPASDPYNDFNTGLLEMLKTWQNQTRPGLLATKSGLQDTQNQQALSGEGMDQFTPGYQASAIKERGNMYEGAITNINDRISNFESALKTAQSISDTMAKNVKPGPETIQAVKTAMAHGQLPSDSVMEKLGNAITEEDWVAYDTATKKEKTKRTQVVSLGGREVLVDMDTGEPIKDLGKVTYAPGTGGPSAGEKAQSSQNQVIDDAIAELDRQAASSVDHKANPDTYRNFMTKFIKANGSTTAFKSAVPIEKYINPYNQKGDLRQTGAEAVDPNKAIYDYYGITPNQ